MCNRSEMKRFALITCFRSKVAAPLLLSLSPILPTANGAEEPRGTPTTTVEQLAASVRAEGFQWKFLGQRLEFTGEVVREGQHAQLRIEGMEKDKLDTAALHNARPDMKLKVGDRVRVRGMIVDQWYAVWQVWCYEMSRADAKH